MPIYEYRCDDCGIGFERLMDISAAEHPSCESCGSRVVRRLPSVPALLRNADVGIGRAAYPISWEQTGGGDHETVLHWQRRVERDRREESANPQLVTLRAAAAERRWRERHTEEQRPSSEGGQRGRREPEEPRLAAKHHQHHHHHHQPMASGNEQVGLGPVGER